MMECKEINCNKDCGFVDRSKVKILLCDSDSKSSQEVFTLLLRCSYQVISVRSARQVINALNAEGPDIDIILTEVDLPMAKGMKMLKYVTRDKELRRIPLIIMSAQDKVSVVVKCLRLGAADYLVKPLRTNELLNLWTHIWRRRRMLGLAEKRILNLDFDLAISDLSDRNTNSATFLSDDTDDNTHRSINPELEMPRPEDVSAVAVAATVTAMEPRVADTYQFQPNVQFINENEKGPKKCKLKIGESSAFFTYCKSNALKSNFQPPAQELRREENPLSVETDQLVSIDQCETGNTCTSYSHVDDFQSSTSFPDSRSMEMSSSPHTFHFSQETSHDEERLSQVVEHPNPRDESRTDVAGLSAQTNHSFYLPGVMNQVLPPSAEFYHKNQRDAQNHSTAAIMPQYSHLHHFPHASGMPPFPYYAPNMCLQPGQMPGSYPWPSFGSSSSSEVKLSKADRREAALIKFRQKRKERCFDKKIRYANRKQLAEKRPRVQGQFVRKVNGINVDLNGQPSSTGNDDDDDETL